MSTTMAVEKRTEATPVDVERTRTQPCYCPDVDIVENAEELTVFADMPGVHSEDIDVRFENGTLTIHGAVCARQPEETRFLCREYGVGDFQRTFQVSETIDAARIAAEYRDGVLTLHLPKVEAAKPRKIAVKSS